MFLLFHSNARVLCYIVKSPNQCMAGAARNANAKNLLRADVLLVMAHGQLALSKDRSSAA
jgi:hypothetical protein